MKLEDLLNPKFEVHIVSSKRESYIRAKGSAIGLLNALSHLVRNLKENGIEDEDIDMAVERGKMSDEELKKSVLESLDKLSEKF